MLVNIWNNLYYVTCCCKCKLMQELWEIVMQKLQKLNIHTPYDSIIPPQGIYIMKMSVYVSEKIIARNIHKSIIYNSPNFKKVKCPSKMVYSKVAYSSNMGQWTRTGFIHATHEDKAHKHNIEGTRKRGKKIMLYDSTYIKIQAYDDISRSNSYIWWEQIMTQKYKSDFWCARNVLS